MSLMNVINKWEQYNNYSKKALNYKIIIQYFTRKDLTRHYLSSIINNGLWEKAKRNAASPQ
jgi:spore maturation protein CgeB